MTWQYANNGKACGKQSENQMTSKLGCCFKAL